MSYSDVPVPQFTQAELDAWFGLEPQASSSSQRTDVTWQYLSEMGEVRAGATNALPDATLRPVAFFMDESGAVFDMQKPLEQQQVFGTSPPLFLGFFCRAGVTLEFFMRTFLFCGAVSS